MCSFLFAVYEREDPCVQHVKVNIRCKGQLSRQRVGQRPQLVLDFTQHCAQTLLQILCKYLAGQPTFRACHVSADFAVFNIAVLPDGPGTDSSAEAY